MAGAEVLSVKEMVDRVGRANGYSVAVTQRAGVGYALASDMDTEKSAQLAALTDE